MSVLKFQVITKKKCKKNLGITFLYHPVDYGNVLQQQTITEFTETIHCVGRLCDKHAKEY